MHKVYGLISEFKPIRSTRARFVISYSMAPEEDGVHATWYEIIFYKKQYPYINFQQIKDAILNDINLRTDEKILQEFVWDDIKVWLSSENQFNFKAAYDLAVQTKGQSLPIKFKLGEEIDETPLYHTFETLGDISDFYIKALAYINQCLNEGWNEKDSIDWNLYKMDDNE